MIKKIYWPSCKVTVILARFERNLSFLDILKKKKLKTPNFIKIRPVGAELFHADGRTDRQT